MKKIQAINNHIIAEEIANIEKITEGGIVIPLTVKTEPQKYGKVLSVGEEVKNVKEGDIIVYHQSGGQTIMINGIIQKILKNDEIYGILS